MEATKDKQEELVEVVKWKAFPCASTSERIKRMQMIEDDPNCEVRFVVQVSPAHLEILYTEKQYRHPPGTDARTVNKEKAREEMLSKARVAAREARQSAENVKKAGEAEKVS